VTERSTTLRWPVRSFESHRPPNPLNRGLVAIAPWLDAMLLVLFFLIVTSRHVLQPGLQIQLPEAPFTGGAAPYGLMAVVVVQPAGDGLPDREILYFDDERFVLDQPAHLDKLRTALRRAARWKAGQALLIESDRDVRHGTLAVMLSAAAEAGIPDVYLATRPPGRGGEGP